MFKVLFVFVGFVYLYICICVCAVRLSEHGGQETLDPWAGVSGSYKPPNIGTWNPTSVLCKSHPLLILLSYSPAPSTQWFRLFNLYSSLILIWIHHMHQKGTTGSNMVHWYTKIVTKIDINITQNSKVERGKNCSAVMFWDKWRFCNS